MIENPKNETKPRLLDSINSPADLKMIPIENLSILAQEIRDEIVSVVANAGGHLASSLGAVELAIALHYVLDAPEDIIIWDVGHQAYAHKVLTGRRTKFKTLRQFGGISGFPNRYESSYDVFTTGHGSTSISTALGMATARDLRNSSEKVVAVIGDASLGGGMAFEALNHAGHIKRDLLVILNDNKMGISPSVGALGHYLNRIIIAPYYNRIRKDLQALLKRVPRFGFRLLRAARRLEESLKSLLVPGMLFEELGFRYFGPIDGHDINSIITTLKNVMNMEGPILIHAITRKGKGYPFAEVLPEKFHGVSSFDIKTGCHQASAIKYRPISYTQAFSEKLVELAKRDDKIVAITAAMPEGTGLDKFAQSFPERFFDVGMAEQHAVAFSAGLANYGLKPVVAIYSTFLQRAFDQIVHDVCLQNIHVIFCLDRAGVVGEDGPTHHGILDIAYLRSIPNLMMMAPKDTDELGDMLEFAMNYCGPIALRYPRGCTPSQISDNTALDSRESPDIPKTPIKIGKAEILKEGEDVALIALGSMVYPSLEAAGILLKEGINVTVVNARFVKPLDGDLIEQLCSKIKKFVTVEEGVLDGGFGSSVFEFLESRNLFGFQLKRLGLPNEFITYGPRELLLENYGLSIQGIAKTIKELYICQR